MYDIADLDLPHAARDAQLTELRSTPGLVRDDSNNVWLVARHTDICTASQDPTVFSNASGVTYFDAVPLSFVTMDPPEHGRLRRIVSRQFTPRMVKDLRNETRRWTESALDAVQGKDEFDFVASVAAPVTLRVIAEMLGVPAEDLEQVKVWTDQMIDAGGRLDEPGMVERATSSYVAWAAYVDEQVELRLESPGDDLLSRLAHAEDERLDRDELALFATALMVAGNETTRHTSSRGVEVLAAHPEQRARFARDPDCRRVAVEEILRWTTVVRAFMRTIATDTVLSGTDLAVGERLVLLYPSANRDAEVFEDPFAFNIERYPNPHLAFGIGTHFCVGATLPAWRSRSFSEPCWSGTRTWARYPGPNRYIAPTASSRGWPPCLCRPDGVQIKRGDSDSRPRLGHRIRVMPRRGAIERRAVDGATSIGVGQRDAAGVHALVDNNPARPRTATRRGRAAYPVAPRPQPRPVVPAATSAIEFPVPTRSVGVRFRWRHTESRPAGLSRCLPCRRGHGNS